MFQISSGDLAGVSYDSKNKAIGYLRLLQSKNYLLYMHFLADVLTHVANFSQLLQKRGLNLAEANDCLEATKDVIKSLKSRLLLQSY